MSDASPAAPAVVSCVLGAVRFAVELDALQQVLPRPLSLITMPRRSGGLQGAFTHRGEIVPLVDLRAWLPWSGDHAAEPMQVLLLRHDGRSLAVGIDRLGGLHRGGAGRVQRLHHGDDADELFHSVIQMPSVAERGEAETALGLLDVASLMRLCKIWMQTQGEGEGEGAAALCAEVDEHEQSVATVSLQTYAVLECDGELLALQIRHLQTVIPMPTLQPVWLGDPLLLGLARWRERDVPVLRTLPALGLSQNGTGPVALLAIVEHDGRCLGLPVQAVLEIQSLNGASAQPATALSVPPSPMLAGLLHRSDGRRMLVVDAAALIEGNPLCAISAVVPTATAGARTQAVAQVVVQAGSPFAVPISMLLSITELPADWAADNDPTAPWCHTWRGQTVPLWDLRALTGRGASTTGSETRVLYLQTASQVVGLVVEALLHLLPARAIELHTLRQPGGRHLNMVTSHDGTRDRSYEAFDWQDWLPPNHPGGARLETGRTV